jgi:hypothetical protein
LFRDELVLVTPAIVIFATVSAQTGFSEHMRYVLPAFPYLFVAVSQMMQEDWLCVRQKTRADQLRDGTATTVTKQDPTLTQSDTFLATDYIDRPEANPDIGSSFSVE